MDVGMLLGAGLTVGLRGPPDQVRLQNTGDTLLLSQSQLGSVLSYCAGKLGGGELGFRGWSGKGAGKKEGGGECHWPGWGLRGQRSGWQKQLMGLKKLASFPLGDLPSLSLCTPKKRRSQF